MVRHCHAPTPLGWACGAGGVENIKRIGGRDRRAGDLASLELALINPRNRNPGPIDQLATMLFALQHDGRFRLVTAMVDGCIEQRLVGDDPDPARCRRTRSRRGFARLFVDAGGRVPRPRKPPKTTEVNGPECRAQASMATIASGTIGTIEDNPVSLGQNSLVGERRGQGLDLRQHGGIGKWCVWPPVIGAVIDDRGLVAGGPRPRGGPDSCGRCVWSCRPGNHCHRRHDRDRRPSRGVFKPVDRSRLVHPRNLPGPPASSCRPQHSCST